MGVALAVYVAVGGLLLVSLASLGSPGVGGGGAIFGERIALVELEGVRINSPGGVVAPTQELHTALRRLREAGKPVVASLGAVAASGGYYVAVAADRIYANPGTLTGSIGVIMQLANVHDLLKKVGVDYVVVKAGQYKDIGSFARPMTPEERRVLQTLLDDVHGQFIAAVAAGRKLERSQVVQFADGRIVSGGQAKALGMVDALGGLEEAIDGAATLAGLPKPPRVVGPRRKFSVVDLLRSELGGGGLGVFRPSLPLFSTPLYLMD
ncbi:MAG: signal peptide peptidase SppA [Candidatus Rokuibacteriota bacterium]|nr:MAG: signal peptide peptidase SppA [Candidatus Rokubacteria bacterium]